MKKPSCTFSYGGRTSIFSFIPQGNETNQESILKQLSCSICNDQLSCMVMS